MERAPEALKSLTFWHKCDIADPLSDRATIEIAVQEERD
jgi:hypothetical protein